MLLAARLNLRDLAGLSRRVATSLEAGLDLRRVWAREAEARWSPTIRNRLDAVRRAVADGDSLHDAINATGEFFPPLFREMIEIGEQTGQLPEVFRRLALHYEERLRMRRAFWGAISWPLLQLAAAVGIVGLVIWIMGWIADSRGTEAVDLFGFGLIGARGAAIWFGGVALLVAGLGAAVVFISRHGAAWAALERVVLAVPVLGNCLDTFALARVAWALELTTDTSMPLDNAVSLSLRASRLHRYIDLIDEVAAGVAHGHELSEELALTRRFPREFLETLEVGERSGRVPESMAVLARQYQERAELALGVLAKAAGFAVWAGVAGVIILLIFRIFSFYVDTLNSFM